MRNLCGFPIPIKFQVTTKHWQQRYTFLTAKSKIHHGGTGVGGWGWGGVGGGGVVGWVVGWWWGKHAANYFSTYYLSTYSTYTWYVITHKVRWYISHSLATSHFLHKIDNYLDLGRGLWGVSELSMSKDCFSWDSAVASCARPSIPCARANLPVPRVELERHLTKTRCNLAWPRTQTVTTVGELRSGVTGFATIFATGSHRFLLQVRNDEQGWDQSSTDKNGEFDLSLARVRYNFSLKYHRAL